MIQKDVSEKGVNIQLFPFRRNYKAAMLRFSKLGYKHFEVGSDFIFENSHSIRNLTDFLNENECRIKYVYSFGNFHLLNRRREVLIFHEKLASLLNELNIKNIILSTGETPRQSLEQGVEFTNMIGKVLKRYEKYQVKVSIHPHLGTSIFTIDDIYSIVSLYNQIKLTADLGHLFEADIPLMEFLQDYSQHINVIHLKDVRIKQNQNRRKSLFCALGEGILNLNPIYNLVFSKEFKSVDKTIEIDYLCNNPFDTVQNNLIHIHKYFETR